MSYLDDYRKAKKKLEEAQEEQSGSFMDRYRSAKAQLDEEQTDDIAPVRTDIGAAQPAQQERTWFQSGALGDGFSLGNLVKTYFGTAADFWENLTAGGLGAGEKALDGLVALGTAYAKGNDFFKLYNLYKPAEDILDTEVTKFIKKDLYDEQAIAKKIISAPIERMTGANTDSDSLLGQKSEGLIQSTGQLGVQIGLQAVGVPWWVTSATTTMGAETEGALHEGADLDSALIRGAISATAEVLTEQIGGIKFKGASLDDGLTKVIARGISNKVGRTLVKLGVDAGSEAMEEGLSWFAGKFGEYITSNGEEKLSQLLASEEAMDELVESLIGGAVMGGGFGTANAVNAKKQGKDYVSGLTKNEQAVIDKVYKDLVAEEAKKTKDGKVSQAKKNELYDQAVAAMDKGYIATDTIEEILGGEDYKAYQAAQEKENAVLKELEGLYQGEELAAQQQSIRDHSTLSQLRQTMGEKVSGLVKRDRLAESYREKGRRTQLFQADVSRYNEKQRAIVQKAIDSGVLNNTNRSHELVDLIAKVGADKALDFDFTNNEKLKESGFALNGKTVNGYVSGSGVTVNINSAKALNSVVGHEITHVLEGTGEFYTALESMVTEYAKSKGEYNARLTELRSLYADVDSYKGADGHEKIKKELVADLVGDYIFTDTDFINRLSVENRDIFDKIYDELKYLCRVATAGSKELRQLEKAKKAFEDAYRQDAKNTADDGGVRYSIGKTSKMTYANQLELIENGKMNGSNSLYVGKPSQQLQAIGLSDAPFAMNQSDYRKSRRAAGRNKNYSAHAVPFSFFEEMPQCLEDAPMVIDNGGKATVITPYEMNDTKGNTSYVIAGVLKDQTMESDTVNLIKSVYPLDDIAQRITRAAEDGKLVVANKNKAEQMLATIGIQPSEVSRIINLAKRSVAQQGQDVNMKFSLSSQEDMFPVRKDLEAVRGNIYGSDVELFPVRQELQAEETAQDPYDDLPFDMPQNLEEGQLSDAELEEDARRDPITTVAERLEVKFASLRQELQTNEQNRKASADAYDQRIAELRQRYDAKPKKHTKAANAILRQIAKQEQLKQQRDAEFEKRINDIKKKIDKTREQMQMDHTREDLLEKQLRQVDEKLEADKQALEEEFRERRAEAERVADRASYFSSEARILRDEILYHKKGTGFSEDIRELLGHGHSFKEIKDALRTVEQYPDGMRYRDSIAEQNVRMILERNYENAVYEADEVETDYRNRLDALEAKAKKDRESYSVAAQRKRVQQQYAQQVEELVGDTSTWQDKKLGIQYQTNTLKRNLRDVVRDENGNRDIAKADAIWDELQGKYNHNEAELKRESARIKQAYADMKITKEEDVYIQMLGEFRHNPETELSLETVEGYYEEHKDKIDIEKVDKAIDLARKTYDDLLLRVNAALREQGMREIPYRKGYFPHFTEEAKGRFRMFLEKALNFKYRGDDIPTDIAGLTEGFAPNRSWQRFNKQRTSDLTAYSFTKGMDSYVHGALDWIYHIEDIQKRRALENHIRYIHSDEGIQDRINEAQANDMWDADQVQEEIDKILKEAKNPLNNLVTDLRTGTNILAGKKNTMDRGMENATNRAVYSVMTSISSRVNANMVAGSVSSALTNFIPITQSWGEVSPVSSAVAMKDTILSYVHDDGVVGKSDFLTNRLRQEENLYKTGWDKVSDKVGWLMEAVDNFTSQTVWRSKYQENLSQGMSEAEAIKNADEFAEGVMAGRSRGNMPTLFDAKNPVARVLTAFQLEVNNQYGYMFKDMPQNMQTEAKGKLVAGYAKMFMGAYAFNALFSQLTGRNAAFDPIRIIQELLGDLFPDEDEEEKKPSEIVSNLAENVLEELPFIGGLMGGGRIPISSALPYGEGPMEMITGTMKDIENQDFANLTWEWLNPAFYLVTPVGGGQIRKTAQGLSMFLGDKPVSGSYTSSGNLRFPVAATPGNIAQAAVFGQWANENARTYIEEGRSPIPESQIQDFLDSGLTYEAWWERKDELKKVDNDFEANEPIMAFRQVLDQVEEIAAAPVVKDEDLLKEKFMRSAADELSDIKADMKDLVTMPLSDTHRQRNMQALQKKANEIAQSAMDAYSKVEFDGDYARVGEKVWKRDEDGDWRRLTGEALTKYQVTSASESDVYATDGTNHYRWYEPGEDAENPEPGWRKVSKKELERQNAVTSALGITPEEYWGDRREEYNYAYENPEKYLVIKATGGYEKYTAYKKEINKLESDKDKDGKTISGSKKNKVIKYINSLDAAYGEKLVLFKSLYPADDTYNQKIVEYLNSRKDLTAAEKKKILEELEFKVNKDGTVTW